MARVELESGEAERERRGRPVGAERLFGDELLVERLATRVAELLAEHREREERRELLDATAVARLLGCNRSFVYEHQVELGAIRLGSGPRARLRFNSKRVEELMARQAGPEMRPQPPKPRARRRIRTRKVELLPIKGRRV